MNITEAKVSTIIILCLPKIKEKKKKAVLTINTKYEDLKIKHKYSEALYFHDYIFTILIYFSLSPLNSWPYMLMLCFVSTMYNSV